jgi:hypothetical protein
MFCIHCGKEHTEDINFCSGCGKAVKPEAAVKSVFKVFGKKGIIVACGAGLSVLLIAAIISITTGNTSSGSLGGGLSSSPERTVSRTVDNFIKDFNECVDFSVFIDGGNIDFAPVEKYFADNSAFAYIADMERDMNEILDLFRFLDIGVIVAGSVVGELAGLIPIFGDALGKLTQREIDNDPLFDRKVWAKFANVSAEASNIVINDNGESATLTVRMTFSTDFSVFKNSRILRLMGELDSLEDENMTETMLIRAAMEKQASGEWLFTRFDG